MIFRVPYLKNANAEMKEKCNKNDTKVGGLDIWLNEIWTY